MLKIWGRNTSSNVQKAMWAVGELGLAHERIDIGGSFGKNKEPAYLAMNPNGLVPVIDEDGFVLYESNAITRYLAARHGQGTLWPDDLRARADVDRWMEWQSTGYTPAMLQAFWQLVRTPPEKRDAAAVEASRAKGEKFSAVLDRHLAGREFVAGDAFSPADIVVGCAAHRWLALPMAREPRANLERWYASLKSRPGARQVTSLPLT